MSIAEARTTGARRRRRLAVTGEQTAAETADGPGGLARLRDRLGDLPASSPWLPRQLWKRTVIGGGYGLTLAAVGWLLARPLEWPASLAGTALQLLSGPRSLLQVYVTTALWLAAGQFAALIGWYRSHSENDFHGRYRIWAVFAAAFAATSFLAGTAVQVPIAQAVLPHWPWPVWRPEVTAWLAPLSAVGLLLGWRMDRDLRRCFAGLWTIRLAMVTLMGLGAGHLFAAELAVSAWYPVAMTLAPIVGPGLLVLGLWLQACYVAYVCADPPEAPARTWLRLFWEIVTWPFGGARETDEAEAKPSRRRKKSDEEDADAAPKRRRKPATRTRRPTKSRRVKTDEDAEEESAEDETASDESWETEESASEESAAEDWEALEAATQPAVAPGKTSSYPTATSARQAPAQDEDDDDDGDSYRVDGAHESADMYKGLSKRQRRELKKQLRDQQRG